MNRNLLIVIGVLVLVFIGGGLFIVSQQKSGSEDLMVKTDGVIEKEDAMMDKSSDSRYSEYSKANLDNPTSRRVLYFYANWCPTCRPADANFKANSNKIPEDLTVIRVNFNDSDTDQEEKDLAKKYGITYQHTFVQIDSNGNEITKWNGGQIDELLANIK